MKDSQNQETIFLGSSTSSTSLSQFTYFKKTLINILKNKKNSTDSYFPSTQKKNPLLNNP